MIVVDSSVWIDFLNGRNAPHVRRLRALLGRLEIIVGDLMLCEVLQGLPTERAAREVEALLRRFEIVPMAGAAIAVAAARNFRVLRRRGITVRKTIDLLIATWCVENRRPAPPIPREPGHRALRLQDRRAERVERCRRQRGRLGAKALPQLRGSRDAAVFVAQVEEPAPELQQIGRRGLARCVAQVPGGPDCALHEVVAQA